MNAEKAIKAPSDENCCGGSSECIRNVELVVRNAGREFPVQLIETTNDQNQQPHAQEDQGNEDEYNDGQATESEHRDNLDSGPNLETKNQKSLFQEVCFPSILLYRFFIDRSGIGPKTRDNSQIKTAHYTPSAEQKGNENASEEESNGQGGKKM